MSSVKLSSSCPGIQDGGDRRSQRCVNESSSQENGELGEQIEMLSSEGDMIKLPLVLITLLAMLKLGAESLFSIVMDQFLYKKFTKDLLGNESVDTSSHPCLNNTGNSSTSKAVQDIQDSTSQLLLYLDLVSYGLGVISCLTMGIFSNVTSRRMLILLPTLGYLIKTAFIPVIDYWELDVKWFYLGYAVDGISGSGCGFALSSYLYTADVTPRNRKRTLGIAIVEGMKGISSAAVLVMGGFLIQDTGIFIPSLISVGIMGVSFLMVFILPNHKPISLKKETENPWTLKEALWRLISPFVSSGDRRKRQMLALGSCSFFIVLFQLSGVAKIRTLFLMNLPFCFDAITLGWFTFGRSLAYHLWCTLSVVFFYKYFPGFGLGILGGFSMLAGYSMYGFARNDLEIYIAPVLACGQLLPVSIIRGELSRLLTADVQGPLFASLAVLESISFAMTPPTFLSIYRASLGVYTGIAFFAAAGGVLVLIAFLIALQVTWVRYMRDVQYQELTVQCSES